MLLNFNLTLDPNQIPTLLGLLTLSPIMDALIVTLLAFIPIFLILLSVFRSTVLSKYLDDKDTLRRQQ